jgi:hypothetical protein
VVWIGSFGCGPVPHTIEIILPEVVVEPAPVHARVDDRHGQTLDVVVSWSVEPPIAHLDGDRIHCLAVGDGLVRARAEGVEATAPLRCRPGAVPVALGPLRLLVGTSTPLVPALTAGAALSWRSRSEPEGVVSWDGASVTALAPGRATVTFEAGPLSVSSTIQVVAPLPQDVVYLVERERVVAVGADGIRAVWPRPNGQRDVWPRFREGSPTVDLQNHRLLEVRDGSLLQWGTGEAPHVLLEGVTGRIGVDGNGTAWIQEQAGQGLHGVDLQGGRHDGGRLPADRALLGVSSGGTRCIRATLPPIDVPMRFEEARNWTIECDRGRGCEVLSPPRSPSLKEQLNAYVEGRWLVMAISSWQGYRNEVHVLDLDDRDARPRVLHGSWEAFAGPRGEVVLRGGGPDPSWRVEGVGWGTREWKAPGVSRVLGLAADGRGVLTETEGQWTWRGPSGDHVLTGVSPVECYEAVAWSVPIVLPGGPMPALASKPPAPTRPLPPRPRPPSPPR